ncbi:poly(A) RNA polymerase cid11-like [Helicoverpa zea]|uniref:poly(A) RNA polymerase cid11-like n=1 Tax=Helicoverpa zea TaxID=7113 RepID=UPI001F5675B1|nr:poly(A) RNA polymerase cid11-like [Helicoverpa zea]
MNYEDILDTSWLRLEGDFDSQVQEVLRYVRLTADRVYNLKHLFDDIEEALRHLAPGCQIMPFGSVVTGLGIKTSDADVYVALPEGHHPTVNHVVQARNMLHRYHRKFTQLFAITKAKVPIVKFFHIPTQFHCDVNFKSPAGVYNSKLVAFLLHMDERALPLAILIKYWSKVHTFTGTNLLGNYALTMMVIFYLQLMNILPSVCDLQRHMPPYYVDGWNTAFDDTMQSTTRNTDSLYELMGGFFKCYSVFNFKDDIISPFFGRVISKRCMDNFDFPEEFSLYKDHVARDVRKKFKTTSKICIQDPFEHSRNCSVAVSDRLAERIFAHIQFVTNKFELNSSDRFLRAILTQDPNSAHASAATAPNKHIFNNKIKKQNRKKQKREIQHGVNKMFTQYQNLKKGKR